MGLSGSGRWIAVATALTFSAGAPGPARATEARTSAPVERIVLPNGLAVILAPDHEAPVAGLELRYRVGSRDDPESRPGLALLVQHLMIRATKHVGEGEYDRALNAAGVTDAHWSTGLDTTFFRVTIPSDELALPLWLWSDQMGFFAGRPDQRLIDEQIATIRNGYVQSIENVPAGRAIDFACDAIYPPGHPYRGGVTRSPEGLRGVTAAEVSAFAASHYTPERATLVLTGQFEREHALALIEKYFGTLRSVGAAPRRTAAPTTLAGETWLTVAARVEVPSVTIVWSTAPLNQPGDSELDVIAQLLVGPRAGYLRRQLVSARKIATTVSAHQNSRELASEFIIKATAAPGYTGAALLSAIDDVLRQMQTTPMSDGYRTAAVSDYLIDKIFALEGHLARATFYDRCDDRGTPGDCLDEWMRSYTNLTAARLRETIVRELPIYRRVVVDVVPTRAAPIAGELKSTEVR